MELKVSSKPEIPIMSLYHVDALAPQSQKCNIGCIVRTATQFPYIQHKTLWIHVSYSYTLRVLCTEVSRTMLAELWYVYLKSPRKLIFNSCQDLVCNNRFLYSHRQRMSQFHIKLTYVFERGMFSWLYPELNSWLLIKLKVGNVDPAIVL